MNSIISLPRLLDLLARASGKDKALCEKFVHVFSNEVGQALRSSGSLKIKGLGQFKVQVSDGRRRIVFTPDREMADAVNAPFACFEPVALAPGVSEEVLAAADDDMIDSAVGNVIDDPVDDVLPVDNGEPSDKGKEENASLDFVEEDNTDEPSSVDAGSAVNDDSTVIESNSLVIDFGFDIPSEEVSYEIEDADVAENNEEAEETIKTEKTEEAEDTEDTEDTEEPPLTVPIDTTDIDEGVVPTDFVPRTGSDDESGSHLESGESEYPGQSIPADETDILDKPQPWAVGKQEDDRHPISSGMDLLTPEARHRMQERKQNVRSSKDPSGGFPWFWVAIAYIGGMAIGFALGFFGHDYVTGLKDKTDDTVDLSETDDKSSSSEEIIDLTDDIQDIDVSDEPEALPADTVSPLAPADSSERTPADSINAPKLGDAPVYDTITPKVNLTSLAQKHYGNKVYWVYIFLDNQDKIKNPNSVVVGTKLRIPPKQQYDVSETDEKANVAAALRKQSEIYTKYSMQ